MPFLRERHPGRAIPRERLEEVGRALLPVRRPQPDQRPEPRRCSPPSARTSPATASTSRSTGATATGTPTSSDTLAPDADDGVTRAAALLTTSPTRPTPAAGSTARTSRTPRPQSCEARPGSTGCGTYFNHPGFVEPMVDATLAGARGAAGRARGEACQLVFVTHSIPERDERRRAGPAAAPTCAQHRSGGRGDRRAGAAGDRPPPRLGPGLLLALRVAPQVPWLEPDVNDHLATCSSAGVPRGRAGADRLRLRPHGGRLRPRHRGARPPPRSSDLPCARAPRPASTHGSWRWCATCSLERAPPSAARTSDRASVGSEAAWDVCARRVLPEPARAAAGPLRPGLEVAGCSTDEWVDLLALARSTRREAGALAMRMHERGVDVADTKSSADRRRHRGRPRHRGADPAPAPGGAARATRFVGEEGEDVVGTLRGALDRRPDRRHGQLPLRPAALGRLDRRERGRRGRRRSRARHRPSGGVRRTRWAAAPRENGVPLPRPGEPPLAGAAGAHRLQLRAVDPRRTRQAAGAALLPQVRDIRRIGSCALDLCHVGGGVRGRLRRGGVSHVWDHAAGGLVATEGGARIEVWPTPRGKDLVLCAPTPMWADFEALCQGLRLPRRAWRGIGRPLGHCVCVAACTIPRTSAQSAPSSDVGDARARGTSG